MRIVTRYLIKEFFHIFFLCLGATVGLYLVVDILERLDSFAHYQAPFGLTALYFLYKIPMIIFQMTPVAVLLSTLLTLGMMARYNELTALKSSGLSLFKIVSPLVILSLLMGAALILANEVVISPASFQAEQLKEVGIKKKERRSFFRKDQLWYHNGNNIYYVKRFDPDKDLLQEVTILTFDAQFALRSRLDAAWAQWHSGNWHFYHVSEKTFKDGKVLQAALHSERIIALPETPETFKTVEKKAEEMSFLELRNLATNLEKQGYEATRYRVDMYAKLSFPLTTVIMVFVGIPFALKTGQSKGIALGIGISLFISFLYWATFSLSVALGHAGAVPPFLAAWFAHLLFIMGGAWLFLNIRQ